MRYGKIESRSQRSEKIERKMSKWKNSKEKEGGREGEKEGEVEGEGEG